MSKQAKHIKVDGLRYHITKYGNLPGVTTVLSNTADKTWVKHWKAKVGEEGAKEARDAGIARGNFTHNAIEMVIREQPFNIDVESLSPQYNKLLAEGLLYVQEHVAEPHLIEVGMVSELGFAGSPDLVAENKNGIMTLFDWKTSRKKKTRSQVKDYVLQLAAYRQLVKEYDGTVCKEAKIAIFYADDAGVGGTYVINLSEDDLDVAFGQFMSRLEKFKLNQKAKIEIQKTINDCPF